MKASYILVAAITLMTTVMGGCSRMITVDLRKPEPKRNPILPADVFLAGAAKQDITPMPGYPMGGHGPAGTTSRGYWTRLYARAIYLEDDNGASLVLVSCDLWAMPAGLADRVAELVRNDPSGKGKHIGRDEIILAATHTHQSPGNYSSSKAYNSLPSHRVGFDRDLFEFLAHRIAHAILEASEIAQNQRARVYKGRAIVKGLFRNRSFDAFILNPKSREILDEEPNRLLPRGVAPRKVVSDDEYKAVDPFLTVLRIAPADDTDATIAMAVFLAVHPEAMSNKTEVYSADLFGVAATEVEQTLMEQRLIPPETKPVVAFFNGAEGDISPDWWPQGRAATVRLGKLLAGSILSQKGANLPVKGDIVCRYRIVKIADRVFCDINGTERRTAREPMIGVAMLGGAEDGRSFFYELGFVEGVKGLRSSKRPEQGSKHPALDMRLDLKLINLKLLHPVPLPPLDQLLTLLARGALTDLTKNSLPIESVPKHVPIGICKLGPVVFAAVPGECTYVMGRQISESVKNMTGAKQVLLVGLANEYLSYFATPQEYEAQHYEGASTLYGPASGPLIQYELNRLANDSDPSCCEAKGPFGRRWYDPGFGPDSNLRDVGAEPYFHDDGLEEVLQDLNDKRPRRRLPHFIWWDELEPQFASPPDPEAQVTPRVVIERKNGNSWDILETDHGIGLVTVNLKIQRGRSKWAVIWMPSKAESRHQLLRFRVTRLDGSRICSKGFTSETPTTSPVPVAPDCVDCRN